MTIQIGGSGVFGIALQPVDDAATGNYTPLGYGYTGFLTQATGDPFFHYYPFTALPYGVNQPVAQLPLEAGRSIIIRGAYKSGLWGGGAFNLIPRLDGDLGYMLLALLGRTKMIKDRDLDGAVKEGVNVHEFFYDDTETNLPYFTTRRKLPSETASKILGEVVFDNRLQNVEFTLPSSGPLSASTDMLGRRPAWDDNPAWADPTYDDDDSFMVGVHSSSMVKMEVNSVLTTLRATGCVFTPTNNLLPPDQSRIIGDPTPLDYPVLSRGATVRVTCLVEDYDLYSYILTNAAVSGSMA